MIGRGAEGRSSRFKSRLEDKEFSWVDRKILSWPCGRRTAASGSRGGLIPLWFSRRLVNSVLPGSGARSIDLVEMHAFPISPGERDLRGHKREDKNRRNVPVT